MSALEARLAERYGAARARLYGAGRVTTIHRRDLASVTGINGALVGEGAPLNLMAGPSFRVLVALAGLKHNIAIDEIMGRSHEARLIPARREAMWLVYTHMPLSLPQIGRLFDRDHTTVLHALRRHAEANGRSMDERAEGAPGRRKR